MLFSIYEFAESKPTIPTKQNKDLDLLTEDMASLTMIRDPEYEVDNAVLSDEEKRLKRDTEASKPSKDLDLPTEDMITLMPLVPEYEVDDGLVSGEEKRIRRDTETSKPSEDLDLPTEDMITLKSLVPDYEVDDGLLSGEEKRIRRRAKTNNCVKSIMVRSIDGKWAVETVTCEEGCYEIKGIFHINDRQLTFPVDCKKKK